MKFWINQIRINALFLWQVYISYVKFGMNECEEQVQLECGAVFLIVSHLYCDTGDLQGHLTFTPVAEHFVTKL